MNGCKTIEAEFVVRSELGLHARDEHRQVGRALGVVHHVDKDEAVVEGRGDTCVARECVEHGPLPPRGPMWGYRPSSTGTTGLRKASACCSSVRHAALAR